MGFRENLSLLATSVHIIIERGKKPEDDFTRELDEEKWRLEYMTLQMSYQEKYEEGMEHEKLETAKRLIRLGKFSLEDIAAGTALSLEKIKEIADMQPV